MVLDIRTLLVAVSVATAFCALARVALWRLHPSIPGLGFWALSSLMGAAALGVMAIHDISPHPQILVVPQILIAGGYLLSWEGFRRFLDMRPLRRSIVVVIVLAALCPVSLSLFMDARWLHSAVNNALIATLSGAITWNLRQSSHRYGLAARLTIAAFGANAMFFALRSAHILSGAEPAVVGTLKFSPFVAVALLWWLCMTVGVTLCMMLLVGERLSAELKELANRDPLTGALNRRAFALVAEAERARSRRNRTPMSLLVMDMDHFKRINDLQGHAAGDQVLIDFVTLLGRLLRAEDVLSRFGGEEFVALLPGSALETAKGAAERIRSGFQAAMAHAGPLGQGVTVSIGVSEIVMEETLESAFQRADQALYRAKAAGRNQVLTA